MRGLVFLLLSMPALAHGIAPQPTTPFFSTRTQYRQVRSAMTFQVQRIDGSPAFVNNGDYILYRHSLDNGDSLFMLLSGVSGGGFLIEATPGVAAELMRDSE